MKKISWATHKSLFGQIASSACLIGASAGIVFGVSAGTFKIRYFDLDKGEARVASCNVAQTNYTSQNISSQWNMYETLNPKGEVAIPGFEQPTSNEVTTTWWKSAHGTEQRLCDDDAARKIFPNQMGKAKMPLDKKGQGQTNLTEGEIEERMKYSTLVIDGATHTAMDRSFNQGLYNGIANFNYNYDHDVSTEGQAKVLKPAQDNTQEFVNIYRAAATESSILCLAGFNHVTPINALGIRSVSNPALFDYADDNIKKTGMMLMDGDVANNQNVASVLFRSDQPAFLAALSTCMYFYNNIDLYHQGYRDLAVGAYGGTAIPTVVIYMGGFQRGIEFFNEFVLNKAIIQGEAVNYMKKTGTDGIFVKNLLPASKYKDEIEEIREKASPTTEEITKMCEKLYQEYSVKMIKLGGFGTHFSGSFASGDAIGISKQLLNRGASAIIAVAGPQSLDTAQEIMNQNKNCIVIGVDSAMERSDYQKPFKNPTFKDKTKGADETVSAQASNIIKFSAVKDMTSVSDKILRLAATGHHWDTDAEYPFLSRVVVPTWTKDQQIPNSNIKFVKNGTDKFNLEGLYEEPKGEGRKVLVLPTTWTDDEKVTRKLDTISGFTGLTNVDTIKIVGETTPGQIKFADGAFDYIQVPDEKKVKYIDFSAIPADAITLGASGKYIFKNIKRTTDLNTCYVKLGTAKDLDTQKNLYAYLAADISEFTRKEADPYKSVCGFGFKTCGNIENGLISISWDGWAPLVQCLKYVTFNDKADGSGTNTTFYQAWKDSAAKYCEKHPEVPDDYKTLVTATAQDAKMITFDKGSLLNKNYSHTTAILGYVFGAYYVKFSKDMTVQLDGSGHASKPSGDTWMTVLDWLKTNMYFIA